MLPKQTMTAITERFEGIAANMLEDMIFEVERKNHLKVTDLEVSLIPHHGAVDATPAVEVSVTVEQAASAIQRR